MPALIAWWSQDLAEIAPDSFPDAVQLAGTRLLQRWQEPHRHYHRTTHLVELFWALEELRDAAAVDEHEATLGRVAAWYHDAVYDPHAPAGANETDSAHLARVELTDLDLAGDDVDLVERLVLLTAGHGLDVDATAVERAFHDADLWVLSAPETRFDDYCQQVRAEYAHLPAAAYRMGRAAVLRGFAARDRIYATDYARDTWEATARANLDRELARLAAPDLPVT